MRRAIGKYSKDFISIVVLVVIAAGVAGYILSNERLRFPWQSTPIKMYANFSTAQAVTPGQGQSVRVSGVQVGTIDAVKLQGGYAQVTMGIDTKYKDLIHPDATALLRPKTGLKDMFIELVPGHKGKPVSKGFTIPIQNTLPDVNPDEVLSSLDADTRDYLKLLIGGFGEGLQGRGNDLKAVLASFLPTSRDLAAVNGAVSKRHNNLSRVIRSLNLLNTALAERGPQITQVVAASAQVFNAFATESAPIQRAIGDLPGTLRQTTQTLGKVQTFAGVLGSATEALRPVGRAITPANKALTPFALKTTPVIRDQIRPFIIDSRPLVRALRPASENLAKATPNLTSSFNVLNHLFNLLGYNKSGPNASVTDPNRDEGYLFWLAWLGHNGASVFGDSDANGVYRALTQEGTCATLNTEAGNIATPLGQAQGALLGTLQVLLNPTLCGPNGVGGNILSTLPGVPGGLPGVPPLPPLPAKKGGGR
jgi:phospholipid/cholesterol/gamma-HCH transport system substrate-binding protein